MGEGLCSVHADPTSGLKISEEVMEVFICLSCSLRSSCVTSPELSTGLAVKGSGLSSFCLGNALTEQSWTQKTAPQIGSTKICRFLPFIAKASHLQGSLQVRSKASVPASQVISVCQQ